MLGPFALGVVIRGGEACVAKPLWPSSPNSQEDCTRAAQRGLRSIYGIARVPKNFAKYGHDYLWCFHTIAATAADPKLAHMARQMGEERARAWRHLNPRVPANPHIQQVFSLAGGSHAADQLGLRDARMQEELGRAAARFKVADFLRFDPARELPPDDVPGMCSRCKNDNERGRRRCSNCGNRLLMQSPYDLLCKALIMTYIGDRYGVRLGAGYAEVSGLIPLMRPYRDYEEGKNRAFLAIAYAITHIVYTLNDYGTYQLKPEWLPQEFEFLKKNLAANIALFDAEIMGEFVDSLKAFGLTDQDPLIRTGTEFLLKTQNKDGSWGNDSHYHPTWTAVDGLRDYAFRGEGVSFPEALERAKR